MPSFIDGMPVSARMLTAGRHRTCRLKTVLVVTGFMAVSALALTAPAPAIAEPGPVYITLGFDDGLLSQYEHRDLLESRGMRGTYYVNTGKLEPEVDPVYYMSRSRLLALAGSGHEVGGHTLDHVNLTTVGSAEQRRQICDDREALIALGLNPTNFAYPNGADGYQVPAQQQVIHGNVRDCGYETARTTRGIDGTCCPFAESLTPPVPYAVRAVMPQITTPLQAYKDVILAARDNGGGWMPLVFHDLCQTADCANFDEYAVDTELFEELLDWIDQEPLLQVRTASQVLAIGKGSSTPDPTPPLLASAPVFTPAPALRNPRSRIAGLRRTTNRRWRLTVALEHADQAKRLQVLINGRVVRTSTRPMSRHVFTLRPSAGRHTVRVRAVGHDDRHHHSSARKLHVKRVRSSS